MKFDGPFHAQARRAACCLILALLAACAGEPEQKINTIPPAPAGNTDFSGAWEIDYSRSDNSRQELEGLIRELRRQQERRQQSGNMNRSGPAVNIGGSGTNSGSSIIGLAEMADMITETTLLEIEQSPNLIQVKREGSVHTGNFEVEVS